MFSSGEINEKVNDLLYALSEPLTSGEEIFIAMAEAQMKQYFIHGFNQLFSLGIDEQGNSYPGLQLDCPIGQSSVCAEVFVIEKAIRAKANLAYIVTVRHQRQDEGEEVHVVASCEACCGRLLHFFPEIQVVVWIKKERRKIPIRALVPIPFKVRQRPADKGRAEEKFS